MRSSGLVRNGGPGQAEPAGGEAEGLLGGLAPGEAVAGVVHLVEDHQRLDGGRAGGVQHRLASDLRVGGHVALRAGTHRADGVGQARVQDDAHRVGRVGPLQPQVVGRADDDDAGDLAAGEQPRGQRQGEGGLAAPGVAVTRKSFGDCSSYCSRAVCCHARSGRLIVCGLKASARNALPMTGSIFTAGGPTRPTGRLPRAPRPTTYRAGRRTADLRVSQSRAKRVGILMRVADRHVTPRRSRRSQRAQES